MKQLGIVFKFEFLGYVKRKSFVALTVVLMLAVAIVLTWPRISAPFMQDDAGNYSEGTAAASTSLAKVAFVDRADGRAGSLEAYAEPLKGFGMQLVEVDESDAELQRAVEQGGYDSAIVLTGPLSYTRYVRNVGMYDSFDSAFSELMLAQYRATTLAGLGVPMDEIAPLLSATVQANAVTVATGKDQMQNFFYTYILIFLLYFAILMYGQFVASSVATEKSTRAMELLITSTKPTSLMFGKVLGAGLAGLTQLGLILGTAFLFYGFNKELYAGNVIIQSIFAMPLSILLYTLLFFVMGFFIYAFLFASMASLVSRMEDLSTAIMPVTFLFIIAFFITMFSMAGGAINSPLMVVASFIPLTSPMAMFARITMGDVQAWEVVLSVVILFVSTIGVGVLAANIYRLGVLLYGNPPKPKEIVKMLRAQRSEKRGA